VNIYEKHPHVDAYKYGGSFTPYAIVAVEKRFTDAELAAEYWQQQRRFEAASRRSFKYADRPDLVAHREQEWGRLIVSERFATLPHFDE
jgi:hypothetical protein